MEDMVIDLESDLLEEEEKKEKKRKEVEADWSRV